MICVVSLIVFSILGIFSATHRKLAKESFNCLKNRAKRQPCDTDIDDRVQASIIGKLLEYSPRTARILNRHFELFSWLLLIAILASGAYLSYGLYNFLAYGNCNGPASTAGCSLNTGQGWLETGWNRAVNMTSGALR